MNKNLIIENTKTYVREVLEGEASGHDWWHIVRVYNMSKHLAYKEGANMFIVEMAALLHDIGDWKLHNGDEEKGKKIVLDYLNSEQVEEEYINKITTIINTMSFKGGTNKVKQYTIEGMVVQDADRLDAIGAIGIARAFAYGGSKGREMYNPYITPQNFNEFEEYKKSDGHTVNHFYEKLLLLKDLINTKSAKEIATERHEVMESFLEQFYKEWNFTRS